MIKLIFFRLVKLEGQSSKIICCCRGIIIAAACCIDVVAQTILCIEGIVDAGKKREVYFFYHRGIADPSTHELICAGKSRVGIVEGNLIAVEICQVKKQTGTAVDIYAAGEGIVGSAGEVFAIIVNGIFLKVPVGEIIHCIGSPQSGAVDKTVSRGQELVRSLGLYAFLCS